MNKYLIFIGGLLAGIVATMFIYNSKPTASEHNVGLDGLTVLSKKGDCIPTGDEIEVIQVIQPNMALAMTNRFVILVIGDSSVTYYDQQRVPVNQCARQVGTYRYTTQNKQDKTVPAVTIE